VHVDSGVFDVGPTFTPIENTVVYLCGFSSWIPYLIWGSRFNFELEYRVTMLTREKWTKRPGTSPAVKGLI
jgi:hypothetical protein